VIAQAIAAALALAAGIAEPLPRRVKDPARWFAADTFYEIYPRAFYDSNGDGHGDLNGIREKLDVLIELGVTGLWLMPIYAGPTEHGYAVRSYDEIDPRYGTMEDAKALIAEAHRRDIAVLLDFVPNHVSSDHPWFVKAAAGDRDAQSHFVFVDRAPEGWSVPWKPGERGAVWTKIDPIGRWYYHAFSPSMPDLDLRDRPTRAWVMRAAEAWLERGADGFRVDAARYLVEDGPGLQADRPETFGIVRELGELARRHGALLVLEVWTGSEVVARYLAHAQMAFDFDRAYALDRAIEEEDAGSIESAVSRGEKHSPIGADLAPFTTNHDAPVRRASVHGDGAQVLANAAVLTSGGVPFLFQGDEIGTKALDQDQIRRPYRWSAGEKAGFTSGSSWREIGGRWAKDDLESQRSDPGSIWKSTQAILQIRRDHPALATGLRFPVSVNGSRAVWSFLRQDGRDRVLVVMSFSSARTKVALDLRGLGIAPNARLLPLFGSRAPLLLRGAKATLSLGPREVQIFSVPVDGSAFSVRFAAPGVKASKSALDRGLVFDDRRKLGFSRDVSATLRCTKDRCVLPFPPRPRSGDALRWSAELPPGPYLVEITASPRGALLEVEGEAMEPKGKRLSRTVFVRDGRLTLAALPIDRGGAEVEVEQIEISAARHKSSKLAVDVKPDRLLVDAPGPGVVEWRMNGSSAEPVERAPIVKEGGKWRATLGPWPAGAVTEIALVIRSEKNDFVTDRGRELVIKVPAAHSP
jgi:alpha-amylase